MELNNKEKKIKQVLTDVNFDIDTDFLWKEVSQELDKEKKKRRFFWILPLLGLALASFFLIDNIKLIDNNSEVDNKIISEFSVTETSGAKSNKDHSNSISDFKNIQENKTSVKTKNTDLPKTSNSKNDELSYSKTINNFRKTTSTSNNSIQESIILAQGKFGSTKTKSSYSLNENIKLLQSNLITKKNKKLQGLFLLDKNNFNLFEINERSKNELSLTTSDFIKPLATTKRFFVGIGIGTIKDISNTSTSTDNIPNKLFERETALWGTNASLQLGVELKNKVKFFGGFDYAHLVTQYYNRDVENYQGSQDAELPFIDPSNNLTSTEGVLASSTTVQNDILWHRHHNMLNFQLGLSKDLLPKSKFVLSPEISLLQNIFSSHKGYYFNEQAPNFVKFERGEENPYRKNTGLKTQLGLNLGYETSQYQFAINASWRNPMAAITNGTNIYQIKKSQLSIQARVNCLLNWEKN